MRHPLCSVPAAIAVSIKNKTKKKAALIVWSLDCLIVRAVYQKHQHRMLYDKQLVSLWYSMFSQEAVEKGTKEETKETDLQT